MKKYDIFISYSRKDFTHADGTINPQSVVSQILHHLEQAGFSYWIDREGIYTGDEFQEVICTAIEDSRVFLFVSSEASNASNWTPGEVSTAVDLQMPIIPLRIDDTLYNKKIRIRLAPLDRIDLVKLGDKGYPILVNSLGEQINRVKQLEAEEQRRQEEKDQNERRNIEEQRRQQQLRTQLEIQYNVLTDQLTQTEKKRDEIAARMLEASMTVPSTGTKADTASKTELLDLKARLQQTEQQLQTTEQQRQATQKQLEAARHELQESKELLDRTTRELISVRKSYNQLNAKLKAHETTEVSESGASNNVQESTGRTGTTSLTRPTYITHPADVTVISADSLFTRMKKATESCLKKTFSFKGRTSRNEFWYFMLFELILFLVVTIPISLLSYLGNGELGFFVTYGFAIPIACCLYLIPSLSASVRRLHDRGKSGWWLLLNLTYIGCIVPLVMFCLKGDPGDNKYGPSPYAANNP